MERRKLADGKSRLIASLGYDKDTQVLEVEFTAGSIYRYKGVPESLYEEFIRADSLGQFMLSRIRGAFEYSRIHTPECDFHRASRLGHRSGDCACWCHKLTSTSREEKQSEKKASPKTKKAR